jgi:hypothetical protein
MTNYGSGWGFAKSRRSRDSDWSSWGRSNGWSSFFCFFPQHGVDPIHTGGQDQGVRREWATNDS